MTKAPLFKLTDVTLDLEQVTRIEDLYLKAVAAIHETREAHTVFSKANAVKERAENDVFDGYAQCDERVSALHHACSELGVTLELPTTPGDDGPRLVGEGGSFREGEWTPSSLCW